MAGDLVIWETYTMVLKSLVNYSRGKPCDNDLEAQLRSLLGPRVSTDQLEKGKGRIPGLI